MQENTDKQNAGKSRKTIAFLTHEHPEITKEAAQDAVNALFIIKMTLMNKTGQAALREVKSTIDKVEKHYELYYSLLAGDQRADMVAREQSPEGGES